jgi:hypothetical protein
MIILRGFEGAEDIFVNEDEIVLAERRATGETFIVFKTGPTALVHETPKEIEDLIRIGWGV